MGEFIIRTQRARECLSDICRSKGRWQSKLSPVNISHILRRIKLILTLGLSINLSSES
jgi:hypothetical protein